MRPAWVVFVVLACSACGDNMPPDDLIVPISGSRIAVQWYGYDDGTLQAEVDEFFDLTLRARCTPRIWIDGVPRCVPIADDAVFVDAACTTVVGRALTIERPVVFVGYDWVDSIPRPARLYQAGARSMATHTQYYERHGETCLGPFPLSDGFTYYDPAWEIAVADIMSLHDTELGDGRLGLRVRETDDGLRVPLGLRDRELDVDCTPVPGADGTVVCAPADPAPAAYFRDPACVQPATLVLPDAPIPTIAAVTEPSGCASYHAVGGEVAPPVYRRAGEVCTPAAVPAGYRLFAVDAALELPALARTVEAEVDRRLQRVILTDGALRFVDDRLHDTAIRADCTRRAYDATTSRCLPASIAPATTLYSAGCVLEVRVAELPQQTCEPREFALATTAEGFDVHAIGDPVTATVYRFDGFGCSPYTGAPGTVLRGLGPAIDPRAFMGAVYFGER